MLVLADGSTNPSRKEIISRKSMVFSIFMNSHRLDIHKFSQLIHMDQVYAANLKDSFTAQFIKYIILTISEF